MKNLFRALRFFRPDAPRMAVVFLLLLGSIGLNVLKPWPLAVLVDSVLGAKPVPPWLQSSFGTQPKTAQILVLAVVIFIFHAGQGIISAAQNYLSIKIGLRGLTRVRNDVFACLQRLSWRFHQGAKSGDILYRASWDTYSFQTLFQQGLITFVTALLSLMVMVVVMARLNGPLTLVALATVPLLLATIKFFANKMTERGVAAQQADSVVASHIQQNMAALPLIQSCTREADEEKKFTLHTAASQEKRLSQHGWELVYWLGISLVFAFGTVAIVWIGSRQVLQNRLSVGELLIFLAYLTQLYEPLNQLSHVGATLTGAGAGTRRVFEILDSPEEVKEASAAKAVVRTSGPGSPSAELVVRGHLAFEKISFAYEKDREVLHDITFEVAAGESVALIGPSGAGKSTLLNLVPRFFDPDAGGIRLDGMDLRELRLKDLRRQIALVLQEPIILPTTIAENIAYGRPEATASEIEAAARAANADRFIRELPKKYETIIGDGAARVSVGEKQRLNLARAFLKDAPIVLLDEPTSALDAESEALVVTSLENLMRGRTVLMVAHRLSTIRQMKKIVVLGYGRLMEMGTQDELIRQDGYFARMIGGRMENSQK